jgi:hypothetical protein
MKKIITLISILIPLSVSAQFVGDYFLWKSKISSAISFKKSNEFTYIPYGKSELLGKGKFSIISDTLILKFEPYADPEIKDCSGFEIKQWGNSLNSDSIKFNVEIFDCESGNSIPFAASIIPDLMGEKNNRRRLEYDEIEIIGDERGKCQFNIPMSNDIYRFGVNAPEYNFLEVRIDSLKKANVEIKARLLFDHDWTEEEGGIEKYQIIEFNRRFLRLLVSHGYNGG